MFQLAPNWVITRDTVDFNLASHAITLDLCVAAKAMPRKDQSGVGTTPTTRKVVLSCFQAPFDQREKGNMSVLLTRNSFFRNNNDLTWFTERVN
jgi:hypothetical protein